MSDDKVWFITGSNTGFGEAIAREALSRGYRAVATARRPDEITLDAPDDSLLPCYVDVTEPDSVRAAVTAAVDRFGRVDVLVNNAGHGLVGALEELSDEELDRVLAVNLRGAATVTRAALPVMRRQRSGTIVQMSSVGGVVANPGHAIYGTSKFALEGMSEALAGEVAPLGIKVLIVEPGPFRTEFAGRSMSFAESIDDYAKTPPVRFGGASAVRTVCNPTTPCVPRRSSSTQWPIRPHRYEFLWDQKRSIASGRSSPRSWRTWRDGHRPAAPRATERDALSVGRLTSTFDRDRKRCVIPVVLGRSFRHAGWCG